MHLIDKAIRISYAKFIATDLQLYKILKITSLIFLGHTVFTPPHRTGIWFGCEKKQRENICHRFSPRRVVM